MVFSSAVDEDHVKALRDVLKEIDQRLSALAKVDTFSHELHEGNKYKKPARKECDYCKKTGK